MTPLIARVRRTFDQPEVADVPSAVAGAVAASRLAQRAPAGGRIAITVGSRGIAGISTIARATVDAVRALGFRPFVVAAMGSHGGGKAEGQQGNPEGQCLPATEGHDQHQDMAEGEGPVGHEEAQGGPLRHRAIHATGVAEELEESAQACVGHQAGPQGNGCPTEDS